MVKLAIIGVGEWGKNLLRNFYQIPEVGIKYCCDANTKVIEGLKGIYPNIQFKTDCKEIFEDNRIDAVVISTTSSLHYKLTKEALSSGKHVFVEKPLSLKAEEAKELAEIADRMNKKLMVGHLLLYHPAVRRLKDVVSSGELGELYYIYSQRLNLGKVRKDENALWSLAPHDISVILYLLEEEPEYVSASGSAYLQNGIPDVVFVNLQFPNKKMANIHLSWLDPHKTRRITVVGSKKMIVFDDMEGTEKLKIFDKGAEAKKDYSSYEDFITLRFGDITIPHLEMAEPLKLECKHFIDCIINNKKCISDGNSAVGVVKILESAQRSLDGGGAPVRI